MELGEKLLILRKTYKLSQKELAKEIGVPKWTISRWENGNTVPDILSLKRIGNIYGMKTDEIMKLEAVNYIQQNEISIKKKTENSFFYSDKCLLLLLCIILMLSTLCVSVGIILSVGVWLLYKNRPYVFVARAWAVICFVICIFHLCEYFYW